MSSWYKISLSATDYNAGKGTDIQLKFAEAIIKSGRPTDLALFSNRQTGKQINLYFSPPSFPYMQSLLLAYSGEPCEKPTEPVWVLVGEEDSVEKFALVSAS